MSDEARLLFRPFVTYAELRARGGASLVERLVVLFVVLGAFVSFTASGRLVFLHFLTPTIFQAHFVVLPCALATLIAGRFAPKVKWRDALCLYLAGAGPWLVFALACSALCVLAPDPGATFRALVEHGVPFYVVVVTLLWGGTLTFAFFREGLALCRARAIAATTLFYVSLTTCVLAWFLFTGQLLPILR